MAERLIVVAAHGHCFDGLVSAAMFTYLRRNIDNRSLRFKYRSCGYSPSMQTVPARWLRGDENAIVDFRYVANDKLTWYFDHHATAFASDEQREQALADRKRFFYDPDYGSCTQLIVDVGQGRFGLDFDRYRKLIEWADRIDSANFDTAQQAIDRELPVMQLAAVVEQHGNAPLLEQLVPRLLDDPLEEVTSSEYVRELYAPIAAAQRDTQQRIEAGLNRRGEVAFVDLHDAPLKASGKFVAYALAPDCLYSVALIRMRQHFKVSVGHNPWCGKARRHDIATICQRYGGGGHPVVGAVSISLSKLEEARRIAMAIIEELNS